MQADLRLLFSHPAHFISLGFGAGLSPRAPGTVGTLLGWLLFPLLQFLLPATWAMLLALGLFFVIGMVCAERTGRALGVSDHGAIVWDEMVAVWLVLLLTPAGLLWQLAAVLLFRFFDIVKPPPVRWADRRLGGGFGVMADDIVAALYSLLLLHAAAALLP